MQKTKRTNRKYSPEYKLSVIPDMREHYLGYGETVRKYWQFKTKQETNNHLSQVKLWERIYLEEGAAGLFKESRGKTTKMDNQRKGRLRKKPLDKEIQNDLIAENQRLKEQNQWLEMENEYLKKSGCLSSSGRAKERQKASIVLELRQKYPLANCKSFRL